MTTPVSFDLAKLLKEKLYSSITEDPLYFYIEDKNNIKEHQVKNQNSLYYADFDYDLKEHEYPAPTIAEVVMWLYEKHNIWILVEHYNNDKPKYIYWGYTITKNNDAYFLEMDNQYFWETPTEAYSAAIRYTLNNLI